MATTPSSPGFAVSEHDDSQKPEADEASSDAGDAVAGDDQAMVDADGAAPTAPPSSSADPDAGADAGDAQAGDESVAHRLAERRKAMDLHTRPLNLNVLDWDLPDDLDPPSEIDAVVGGDGAPSDVGEQAGEAESGAEAGSDAGADSDSDSDSLPSTSQLFGSGYRGDESSAESFHEGAGGTLLMSVSEIADLRGQTPPPSVLGDAGDEAADESEPGAAADSERDPNAATMLLSPDRIQAAITGSVRAAEERAEDAGSEAADEEEPADGSEAGEESSAEPAAESGGAEAAATSEDDATESDPEAAEPDGSEAEASDADEPDADADDLGPAGHSAVRDGLTDAVVEMPTAGFQPRDDSSRSTPSGSDAVKPSDSLASSPSTDSDSRLPASVDETEPIVNRPAPLRKGQRPSPLPWILLATAFVACVVVVLYVLLRG